MQKGPFTAPPVISFLSWPPFFLSPPLPSLLYPTFAVFLRADPSASITVPLFLPSPALIKERGDSDEGNREGLNACVCPCLYFSKENT